MPREELFCFLNACFDVLAGRLTRQFVFQSLDDPLKFASIEPDAFAGSTVVNRDFGRPITNGDKFVLTIRTFQVPRFHFKEVLMFPNLEIHPIEIRVGIIFGEPKLVTIEPHSFAVWALIGLHIGEFGGFQVVTAGGAEFHRVRVCRARRVLAFNAIAGKIKDVALPRFDSILIADSGPGKGGILPVFRLP